MVHGLTDMALFKFTKKMKTGDPIDVYNHGKMMRDFTYVGDLLRPSLYLLMYTCKKSAFFDSLSPVALADRNIGNAHQRL